MPTYSRRYSARDRARRPFALLLVPLVAVLMYRWWSTGMPLSPRGESVPQMAYLWMLRRLWASGDALGGWNPLVLGGMPTVTARVYHLHLSLAGLSYLLGITPEWILKLVQAAMGLLGAYGMYRYTRRMGGAPPAALVSATAFLFFPARVMLTVESIFVTCAWAGLPYVFWGYERTRDAYPLYGRAAVIWSLPLAWIALTGPQWFLLLLTPLATYIALRELLDHKRSESISRSARRLGITLGVAGLAVLGLSLFYYLPAILEQSWLWTARYVQVGPASSRWSVAWSLLGQILTQRWTPAFDAFGWDLARIFPNITLYLGIVLCALALLGIIHQRRWSQSMPLLGVLLVSLLLAAGPTVPYNPAYFVVRRIPYISDSIRNAFRYLWPTSFALAGLAAYGVERFDAPGTESLKRWTLALGAMMLLILDVWPLTRAYGVTSDYFPNDVIAAHRRLDETLGNERYWVPFQTQRPGLHYTDTAYGTRYNRRASIADDQYHSPSAPYRASLYYVEALRDALLQPSPGLADGVHTILNLSNVRYVLVHLWPEVYEEAAESLAQQPSWRVLQKSEHVALLENEAVHPYARAYGAGLYSVAPDDEELLEQVTAAVRRGYALVERPLAGPAVGDTLPAAIASDIVQPLKHKTLATLPEAPAPATSLSMARPQATRIWLRYQTAQPALVMISETWYPHWRVLVNGEERPLLRLNGNFQGVYIESGEGQILFQYRQPWYVWAGLGISVLSVVAVIAYLVRPRPVRLGPDV